MPGPPRPEFAVILDPQVARELGIVGNQTAAIQEVRNGISDREARRRLECLRKELASERGSAKSGSFTFVKRR